MMKDIRLVGLDLDGTTFTSAKQISERTRSAIAEAIKQGVYVMPSTGRPKNALPEAFISIPGVRYAVTSNGGALVDLKENRIIHGDFVPYDTACQVVDALLSLDALVEAYHAGICYADCIGYEKVLNVYHHMPQWFRDYVRSSRTPVPDLKEMVYSGKLEIEKFLATFDDDTERKKAFERMSEINDISVCYATSFNIEVSSATATKGNALLAFAEQMGIDRSQIMVCGDSMNDYSMFEIAGLAVAMGNAEPKIKEAADYVTLSNDEDGVAYAIEKFVLK